jgi:hypothetical protein
MFYLSPVPHLLDIRLVNKIKSSLDVVMRFMLSAQRPCELLILKAELNLNLFLIPNPLATFHIELDGKE